MDLGIAGVPALVMGASRGIGAGIARRLASEGCAVLGVARGTERLEAQMAAIRAGGGEALGVSADLTTPEGVARAFAAAEERIGAPRIVVYNPPTPGPITFLDSAENDYLKGFEELVHGFARVARAALPSMIDAGWGRIITVGSASVRQPMREGPGGFGYAVANTARLAAASLSKVISTEVAPHGVTVNTIAVGAVRTDTAQEYFRARAAEQSQTLAEFEQLRVGKIPMLRDGTVDEISSLAAYLASDAAGYVTGEAISFDGGWANTPI